MAEIQFYGVRTTGIYCRIGCPSRRPNPENVIWLQSRDEALKFDLRPCKRCRPDRQNHPLVDFNTFVINDFLTLAAKNPNLNVAQLASLIPLSKRQLERVCKQQSGLTPRALLKAALRP